MYNSVFSEKISFREVFMRFKKNTAMVNQPSDVILGAEKCKNEPLFGTKKALKNFIYKCIYVFHGI